MSVHWKNELVDSYRVAVATVNGQDWYCYTKDEITLKNGSKFQIRFFLKMKPANAPSGLTACELPYGTRVDAGRNMPVVVNER